MCTDEPFKSRARASEFKKGLELWSTKPASKAASRGADRRRCSGYGQLTSTSKPKQILRPRGCNKNEKPDVAMLKIRNKSKRK